MAKQTLNNSESGLVIRGKINDNFTEIYEGNITISGDKTLSGNTTLGTLADASVNTINAVTTKSTASNYTIGTTSTKELYGGVIYVTGACTITIPAVAAGMSFTVVTVGAFAVSVDPNASDLIIRDGTTQADGEKVTNASTTGDIAVFSYYDATGFYCTSNGWTNGG